MKKGPARARRERYFIAHSLIESASLVARNVLQVRPGQAIALAIQEATLQVEIACPGEARRGSGQHEWRHADQRQLDPERRQRD